MSAIAISPAGEFRRVNAFGQIDLRIVAPATEGEMAVFETIVAPDAGPPLHIHTREDETFYILAGLFQIWIGDRTVLAAPGATMFLPRGIPHTFRNIGKTDGRILCMATPGGFEEFFMEVERTGVTDPAELDALAANYGLTFVKDAELPMSSPVDYGDRYSA
jgi:mannose-6-phosphate isomerase-like protein (cupin superfamily)